MVLNVVGNLVALFLLEKKQQVRDVGICNVLSLYDKDWIE